MCNLYSHVSNIEAIRALVGTFDVNENVGNFPPLPGIFPDYPAPIVRNINGGRELANVRWGMPSSKKAIFDNATKRADKLRAKGKQFDFDELLRMEPDGGTTNIRNTSSQHWRPWLGVESRCVVPFTSFSEFDRSVGKSFWFALDESRPLAFFAGIWAQQWTSVRKIKTGVETIDLFGFLTTKANAEVEPIHPKAMPVILRTADEIKAWMTLPWDEAKAMQKPLPDGTLKIVATGQRQDGGPAEPTWSAQGALL